MITKLIIGLGNPGPEYISTPHNVGFRVLDALAQELDSGPFKPEPKFQAEIAQATDVLLVKPQTFMNNSGSAVEKIAHYYKIPVDHIFVVHDEFSLPLGELKISISKGSANHNGVKSLFDHFGSDNLIRFRVGIGKASPLPLEKYVLASIAVEDEPTILAGIARAVTALKTALSSGITAAMNQFN